jgi:hypothetical protein
MKFNTCFPLPIVMPTMLHCNLSSGAGTKGTFETTVTMNSVSPHSHKQQPGLRFSKMRALSEGSFLHTVKNISPYSVLNITLFYSELI